MTAKVEIIVEPEGWKVARRQHSTKYVCGHSDCNPKPKRKGKESRVVHLHPKRVPAHHCMLHEAKPPSTIFGV